MSLHRNLWHCAVTVIRWMKALYIMEERKMKTAIKWIIAMIITAFLYFALGFLTAYSYYGISADRQLQRDIAREQLRALQLENFVKENGQ